MPITPERRAEINRENARKSTGPKTEAGKAASRRNALKHGLTAETIEPDDDDGPPDDTYQHRLEAWLADLRPRNVLERAMIARACRSSWKLDQCARYEEAAHVERMERPLPNDPEGFTAPYQRARYLGNLLMLTLDNPPPPNDGTFGPPRDPLKYDPFNDIEGAYRSLCTFVEGIDWLLSEWTHLRPGLPGSDGVEPEGPEHFLASAQARALRLLGLRPADAPTAPLRDVGDAECLRLESLRARLTDTPATRHRAALTLFDAAPESQLLIRYEASAARELHRAVDTFLKLRKNPELLVPNDPEPPAPAPELATAPRPDADEAPAPPARRPRPRRTLPPSRNEASPPDRLNPEKPARNPGKPARAADPPRS